MRRLHNLCRVVVRSRADDEGRPVRYVQRRGRGVEDRASAKDHVGQLDRRPALKLREHLPGVVAAVGELYKANTARAAGADDRLRTINIAGVEDWHHAGLVDGGQDIQSLMS